jgi:ribonuclease HII
MKKAKREKWIIGIDEVGRGALAGPVMVAAVAIRLHVSGIKYHDGKLRDSKQLSAKQREVWFAYFKNCPDVSYVVARVYPRGIERTNISKAANRAAYRAHRRLMMDCGLLMTNCPVFLDGGLYLKNRHWQAKEVRNAKTMVKADERITAAMIASIVAKVSRDRYMCKLAKKWTGYGFDIHKGYGTESHYRALRKQGPCPAHRLTFLKKRDRMYRNHLRA